MVISAAKFGAFISYLSEQFHIRFAEYNCEDMLAAIRNMNETIATPVVADCDTVDRLMMLMNEGTQKIEAIKAYRTLTGLRLYEAKNTVEKYWKPSFQIDKL